MSYLQIYMIFILNGSKGRFLIFISFVIQWGFYNFLCITICHIHIVQIDCCHLNNILQAELLYNRCNGITAGKKCVNKIHIHKDPYIMDFLKDKGVHKPLSRINTKPNGLPIISLLYWRDGYIPG